MKRKKTTLRQNAALAKTRLVTGFWKEVQSDTVRPRHITLQSINNPNSEEEQLYRRVAALLAEGQSPLANILDHVHMATLCDASRQRYVLNMSNLVQKSIERYNKVG